MKMMVKFFGLRENMDWKILKVLYIKLNKVGYIKRNLCVSIF